MEIIRIENKKVTPKIGLETINMAKLVSEITMEPKKFVFVLTAKELPKVLAFIKRIAGVKTPEDTRSLFDDNKTNQYLNMAMLLSLPSMLEPMKPFVVVFQGDSLNDYAYNGYAYYVLKGKEKSRRKEITKIQENNIALHKKADKRYE